MRNISFGGQAERDQDRRVSAAKAPVGEPQLLFTFLGRVSSRAGREFERVLAIRMKQGGCVARYCSGEEWAPLRHPEKAIPTRDLWQRHFAPWGDAAGEPAKAAALEAFQPIAKVLIAERAKALNVEKRRQEEWLAQRCGDLVEEAGKEPREAPTLFDESPLRPPSQDWLTLSDPRQRLAALGV